MDMQTEQRVDSGKKAATNSADSPAGGSRTSKRMMAWGGILVVIIVLLLAGSFFMARKPLVNENKNINKSEFQAVFLTNGQVYFGKLADLNNKYVTIKDIYYLQVQQGNNLQGASGSTSPNSQVSLAKLGNELHGPEDKMYIANDQMLFWENLKGDSKVVQAINKYQTQH